MKVSIHRALVALLAFAISVGATAIVLFRHAPPARHMVVSKLSDEQQQAAEVITLPARYEPLNPFATKFDFDMQVGIAEFKDESLICLTIMNAGLVAGSKVLLAVPDNNVLLKTVVERKLPQGCSQNPDTPSRASFYSLKLMDSKNAPPYYGDLFPPLIGLVGVEDFDRLKDGSRAPVDLDRDGRREYFRDCTSSEGVHLTIWSGKPLKGKRLWSWYYYLGYDVVPDCDVKDYAKEQDR